MSEAQVVRYEVEDGIAVITVDNPPVNALGPGVREGIIESVEKGNADPNVSAMVLIGAGRSFIAGADIRQFGKPRPQPARRSTDVLDDSAKPVVAAIHGYALGGGLEHALACNYRIAVPSAKVGLPEVLIGVLPGGGGTQRLPRLVGRGKALEMILTGARIPAAEALRIGLVERMVPAGEALKAAHELARTIAEKAPIALRYAKESVVKGLGMALEDGLRLEGDLSTLLRTTEDRVEGAKAFIEKRKPRWTGK